MELIIYDSFSKEANSTKQPTGGTTKQVVMKNDTSIITPVFLIDGVDLSANYCKWNNRYYFINDIVLGNNNIYELHCNIDVMATWKSQILASKQYVLRSASNCDVNIEDNMYPAKTLWSYSHENLTEGARFSSNKFSIVLGIMGRNSGLNNTMGAVSYYLLSPDNCASLLNYLMTSDNPTYLGIDSATLDAGLQKALINPISYISTCMAVPLNYSELVQAYHGNVVDHINIGWWQIGNIEAFALTKPYITSQILVWTKSISIPSHPLAETRSAHYLSYNNWAQHSLYIEPYGVIPLDTTDIDLANNITISEYLDVITGAGILKVTGTSTGNQLISYNTAQLGVPLQLSQMNVDTLAQRQAELAVKTIDANNLMSGLTLGSQLAQGNVWGAAGTLGQMATTQQYAKESAIIDARRASYPVMKSSGQNGSLAAWKVKPMRLSKFSTPVDDDNTHLGRPLCKDVTLSTLSGFCMTRDAELKLPCLKDEVEMVKSYMNGGFYIE